MKLENKIALVTGGSRGIGTAIALRLAEEGASVAFTYVSSETQAAEVAKKITSLGVKALAIRADSADAASVANAVEETVRKFGRLDILVNNAGVFVMGAVDNADINPEVYDRQFAINVKGPAAAVRAATKYLKPGGRIINIGSVVADQVAGGLGDYAATKAALAAYTQGWARDLGPKGITVNVVQPGPINTDMNPDGSDFAESLKGKIALGRYGRAEEVAAAVAFLASPEASFISGAHLNVDGGFNA